MNQLSFKLISFASILGTMLGIGAISAAQAEDVPTGGTVSQTSGSAFVNNIADLKAPLDAANYDDDPAGEPGSEWFHVAPNLGDDPLQMANKYIVVWNPSDVAELQVTIRARPSGRVMFEQLLAGEAGLTGASCNEVLGAPGTPGTVADGLVATGQKSSDEITEIKNRCTQRTGAIWQTEFPVSKHLPPGWYDQCVAISHIGGGSTTRVCTPMRVVGITGYSTDVGTNGGIDFGGLRQGVTSIADGDFVPGNELGTIMGTGNTSPVLSVAYSWMKNNEFDPGAPKFITNDFDTQISRRDDSGLIVAFDLVDGMMGGGDPDSAEPFAQADIARLAGICLEPNEPLKLDFSVTPRQVLYDGAYAGLVRLVVGDAEPGENCQPTLGAGEHAGGDSDGPFNNLPGEPVEQELSTTPEEPTEEPTEAV